MSNYHWYIPKYEVECQECGQVTTVIMVDNLKMPKACPKCGWTDADQTRFEKKHRQG